MDHDWEKAKDEPAFSNGTEFEMWAENWCRRPCQEDKHGECPIIMTALLAFTPVEWLPQPADQYPSNAYHCVNFRGPDERDEEPKPLPDPPDMDALFEAPERRARMFVRPQPAEVKA
ncbi:hypothetical protein C8D88_11687 [Lentzea atacamensis]|uniref:Uncharacterized protein n=1 Tax=Lentzea atacamensis TaxID=531938 RepID=A0A316HKB3_9PSEU|nr:hypothetical protein [Lentzea atacamensis]PWK81676.1 hypothetical protein C8D88_11687 [Lentzea atacamensis]